jgi:hypothetical protein
VKWREYETTRVGIPADAAPHFHVDGPWARERFEMNTWKLTMAGAILALSVVAVLSMGCAEDGEGRP